MCNEWRDSFVAFERWAMSNGYIPGLTVDRIDNDDIYTPANCRLANRAEQSNNRRNNIMITYRGQTHGIKWWAEKTGVKYETIYYRIKHGWSAEEALAL